MSTKIICCIVAAVTVLSVVTFVKAEVDCNERPKFADPKTCCPVPNLIGDDLIEKCKMHKGGPPHPPPEAEGADEDETDGFRHGPPHHHHGPHGHHGHHHHHHHHCFPSCVFNETGILIDGQLDEGNLDTFLIDADADIVPVLKESFQYCYEKSQEMVEKMREHFEKEGKSPPSHGHHHCPPQAGIMFGCAMMKTFKECPDSIWSGTDECNAAREYFTECMPRHGEHEDEDEEEDEDVDVYEDDE